MALASQIGFAKESTWGTYETVTRFLEFQSESLTADVRHIESRGKGRGRHQQSRKVVPYVALAAGDTTYHVMNRGFGLLFELAFGAVATTQPDNVGAPNHYLHKFTPDASGMRDVMASVQVGREAEDGSLDAYTYLGGKVVSWTMTANLDEAVIFTPTWDFKTESLTESLATAVYPTAAQVLTFVGGQLRVDTGSGLAVVEVESVELTGDNALKNDRRYLGNRKKEPLPNGPLLIEGTFNKDYQNTDEHEAWRNGDLAELELTFEVPGSEIDTGQANPYQIVISVPEFQYRGGAPTDDSDDPIMQNLSWKALQNAAADPVITLDYHTDDATP